jgi:hypothetical protein
MKLFKTLGSTEIEVKRRSLLALNGQNTRRIRLIFVTRVFGGNKAIKEGIEY